MWPGLRRRPFVGLLFWGSRVVVGVLMTVGAGVTRQSKTANMMGTAEYSGHSKSRSA